MQGSQELELLEQAISSAIGFTIKIQSESNKNASVLKDFNFYSALCLFIHPDKLFDLQDRIQSRSKPLTSNFWSNKLNLFVKTLTGETITLRNISSNESIRQLKLRIQEIKGIHHTLQRIICFGHQLEDWLTISDYDIINNSTLHLVLKLKGGRDVNLLDPKLLDTQYNYNFTNIDDSGKKFYRGGLEYKRPCGWMRFALKASGMFDDGHDAWLGHEGNPGEWAVSYHGTAKENIEGIISEQYRIDKSKRFIYGKGIYSSPFISVAETFAKEFSFNGKSHKVVFQNRINQNNMQIVYDGNYFLSPNDRDLRPYGVCIKSIENTA